MSATAHVPTGAVRARATSPRTTSPRTGNPRTGSPRTGSARTASPRTTSPRTSPTRRTGPVQVRPQLRLVTAPVGTPTRTRRTAEPKRRRAPFVVLVVALLAATALSLLALNTAIAVDSLAATEQRTANAELSQQVERLEQQVTDARTPARLAAAAAAAGLVPAGAAGHVVLGPDGTSVVRGAPVPATVPGADPAGG